MHATLDRTDIGQTTGATKSRERRKAICQDRGRTRAGGHGAIKLRRCCSQGNLKSSRDNFAAVE